MRIALLGYGKMGKTIEKVAQNRHHEISLKVDKDTAHLNFKETDVAIDFSTPDAAVNNITACFKNGIPVISGTTGWLNHYEEIVNLCKAHNGTFLYASNFSLGVNIFFEVNRNLAKLIKDLPEYKVVLEEIHHTQKLDAPSGTAITLAEDIIEETNYQKWTLSDAKDQEIEIAAKRINDVPGTHTITWESDVDTIEIKHTAHNRQGFALGAVIAAEWIMDKKGIFTMKDVLNIG